MRLLEPAIKAAILHPEEEVRLTAAAYFSGSFSQDETIMPLIVQAVERHGRDKAFRILRDVERLPQTLATIDWLIGELRRDYDLDDLDDDNYRFAVALLLYHASPELLLQRRAAIAALLTLPDQLREPLDERLKMLPWNWDRGWGALEALGQDALRRGGFSHNDVRYAQRIVEALARHRASRANFVLRQLQRDDAANSTASWKWLEPLIVNLAGAMRLELAIPMLVERLSDDSISVSDESITALIRIGADAVVRAIVDRWPEADAGFRAAAADVLEHIHTDLCAEHCLRLFTAEEDVAAKLSLAHAVLGQFVDEGLEPVRRLVLGRDDALTPDDLDVRYRLVAVCMIMGASFPEFANWHADAVADNWGLGDYTPLRLADSFPPDQARPTRSKDGNGKR